VNNFRIVRVSIYVETSQAVKDELRRVIGEPGTLVNLDATQEHRNNCLTRFAGVIPTRSSSMVLFPPTLKQ
jgi:hypothetical protein